MIALWSQCDPLAAAVLAFVTLQRLAELAYSRRNEVRLRKAGGVEYGAAHYPLIVVLHAAWLVGLWTMGIGTRPAVGWLAAFGLLQGLRLWVLGTLGTRWTTRIIVLPGAPLIKEGPYRFLPHPNYAVVAGEIFVLPMAFALVGFACLFSVLNAVILALRIHIEDAAISNGVRQR